MSQREMGPKLDVRVAVLRPLKSAGFWNNKLGVLAGNFRAAVSFMGHDRPLHDQWLGVVCRFRQWSETLLFDERRLLPAFRLLKKYVAGTE